LKILFVTLIVVVLDQVTKLLIKGLKVEWLGINIQGMHYGQSKPLFGEIVRLTFIENPGMAFGIDIGPKMFLTIFTIIASVFIFFYIYKHRKDGILIRLSLALILAGAVGNLIDRTFYGLIYNYAPIFHGKVVDFVQIEFWDFTFMGRTYTTWPIFNIADVSVSAGFLIILVFHNRIFKQETKADIETSEAANRDIPPELENSSGGFITDNSQINTSKINSGTITQNFYSEDTKKNVDSGPGGTDETKN
jgi:signal peptidase II